MRQVTLYIRYLKQIQVWPGQFLLHTLMNALEGGRQFLVNILAMNAYIRFLSAGDGTGFFQSFVFFSTVNALLWLVNKWYGGWYYEKAAILTEKRIYGLLFERAAAVPYTRYESAEYLKRVEFLTQNAGATYRKAMDQIGRFVSLFSSLVFVSVFLFSMDKWLLPVMAAPFIATKLLKRQAALRHEAAVERAGNDRKKAYVRRKFFFQENMDEMRTSGAYEILDGICGQAKEDNIRISAIYGNKLALLGFGAESLGANFASLAGNLYAVIKILMDHALTISDYSVLVLSIANLNAKLTRIGSTLAAFSENRLYIEDFLGFFEQEAVEERLAVRTDQLRTLEVSEIYFQYPKTVCGIRNITFSAGAGDKIVIVGENGAGKSTLLKVLLGLYLDYTGTITINGQDVGRGVGGRVFCMMQDYQLYPGTIAENLLLRSLKGETDERAVWEALRKIGLEKKVRALPSGIHTDAGLFGEGEHTGFSMGESQRLALGRLFLLDYDIAVLDEPTAYLDPLTEGCVLKEVFSQMESKLLILVTHRLSFARLADQIIYLEKGEAVEQGIHEELMLLQGRYYRMFSVQRAKFVGREDGV